MFIHRTPLLLRWFFQDYIWKIKTSVKEIYLTFDDGPIPRVTENVLKVLLDYNAKATFFCIGDNVRKHPGVFRAIKDTGHSIGNHTYNHLNGWKTDNKVYIDNFHKCQDVLETDTVLFRPPYGRIRRAQYKMLPETTKVIMWDVLTGDYTPEVTKEKALAFTLNLSTAGTILLLHDSIKAQKTLEYVLPRTLEHFSEKGYQFKSIPMK